VNAKASALSGFTRLAASYETGKGSPSPAVEERGRYSNLPRGRLYALRMLADGDFANGIQESHSLLSLSKKDTAGLVDRRQPSAISQPGRRYGPAAQRLVPARPPFVVAQAGFVVGEEDFPDEVAPAPHARLVEHVLEVLLDGVRGHH
jgi:hypothetical protein